MHVLLGWHSQVRQHRQLRLSPRPRDAPFEVDVEWLRRERPGLVVTEEVCSPSRGGGGEQGVVLRALLEARLVGEGGSTVLILRPRTLSELLESIVQVGI
jgi:hypothetical protein